MVKEFNISACGNISKILDKPSKLIKRNLNNTEPEAKIEDYYECPYCGSIFNYGASRCYSCGAPVRKKQKNNCPFIKNKRKVKIFFLSEKKGRIFTFCSRKKIQKFSLRE